VQDNKYFNVRTRRAMLGEENDWGWLWWHDILEEEEQKECPKCGSDRIHYDKYRQVWICLNCDYEWEDEEG